MVNLYVRTFQVHWQSIIYLFVSCILVKFQEIAVSVYEIEKVDTLI